MKSLKVTLWIAAIGCLVAVPFILLPGIVAPALPSLLAVIDPLRSANH